MNVGCEKGGDGDEAANSDAEKKKVKLGHSSLATQGKVSVRKVDHTGNSSLAVNSQHKARSDVREWYRITVLRECCNHTGI